MLDDFSQAEKTRINELYATDFEGITPEDVALIQRFEREKAISDKRFLEEIEARKIEAEAIVEETHRTAQLARDRLEERAQRSRDRWEMLRNG